MAQIPMYQPSVPMQAPGSPDVALQPATPAASSANVSEAAAKIGEIGSEMASRLEQHMIMRNRMAAQQEVYNRAAAYRSALQDAAEGRNGFLTRQGKNAIGAVDEYDQMTRGVPGMPGRPGQAPLMSKFAEGLSPYQQKQYERLADSYTEIARGQIIKHQADQEKAYQKDGWESSLNDAIDSGKAATNQGALDKIKGLIENLYSSPYAQAQGWPDEQISRMKEKAYAAAVTNSIDTHLEDPERAQKILNGAGVSDAVKASLQQKIDGKMLDIRKSAVWDATKDLTHPDGTIDLAAAEQKASDLAKDAPPTQRPHIMQFVREQARVQDAQLKDARSNADRQFDNDAIKARQSGQTYDQAFAGLIKSGKYGFDAKDIQAKQDMLQKVYTGDPDRYDKMMEHWSEDQKNSWAQLTNRSKDLIPYGTGSKEFMDSLKERLFESHDASPANMQKLFDDSLKSTPTGETNFWGMHQKNQEYYKTAQDIQKNRTLVDALGGTDKAYQLALRIGGPAKLMPDAPESKAIMALIQAGVDPNKIGPRSVEAAMQQLNATGPK